MTHLENMISSALSVVKQKKPRKSDHRSSERELSESSDDSEEEKEARMPCRSARREGRSRRKEPTFPQDKFLQEGETMASLNTVVLAGVRQVRHLLMEGQEAGPILKHVKFLFKKSTLGVYRHKAYISYDRAVRSRADRDGISAFGAMATEELATSFCPENLISTKNRDGKSTSQGNGKSSRSFSPTHALHATTRVMVNRSAPSSKGQVVNRIQPPVVPELTRVLWTVGFIMTL